MHDPVVLLGQCRRNPFFFGDNTDEVGKLRMIMEIVGRHGRYVACSASEKNFFVRTFPYSRATRCSREESNDAARSFTRASTSSRLSAKRSRLFTRSIRRN